MFRSPLYRLLILAGGALNRLFEWHKLPRLLGLLTLVELRHKLRERNLYDTSTIAERPVSLEDGHHLTARTADGSYNDLENPVMGKAGTSFGRNVPSAHTPPDNDWAIEA